MTPVHKRHFRSSALLLAVTALVLSGCIVCQGHGGSASNPKIACGFRI